MVHPAHRTPHFGWCYVDKWGEIRPNLIPKAGFQSQWGPIKCCCTALCHQYRGPKNDIALWCCHLMGLMVHLAHHMYHFLLMHVCQLPSQFSENLSNTIDSVLNPFWSFLVLCLPYLESNCWIPSYHIFLEKKYVHEVGLWLISNPMQCLLQNWCGVWIGQDGVSWWIREWMEEGCYSSVWAIKSTFAKYLVQFKPNQIKVWPNKTKWWHQIGWTI
jgi:hypothetical protein